MLKRILYMLRGWYKDEEGFWRDKEGLRINIKNAYKVYLRDRDNYPLPFEYYIIHHLDRNKENHKITNLVLLTTIEKKYVHGKIIREELPYIMKLQV